MSEQAKSSPGFEVVVVVIGTVCTFWLVFGVLLLNGHLKSIDDQIEHLGYMHQELRSIEERLQRLLPSPPEPRPVERTFTVNKNHETEFPISLVKNSPPQRLR